MGSGRACVLGVLMIVAAAPSARAEQAPPAHHRFAFRLAIPPAAAPARFDADDERAAFRADGAMVDFFPLGDGFRVSAGARRNVRHGARPASRIEAELERLAARPDRPDLDGVARMPGAAPAVTVGYAGTLARRVALGVEAGALLQGAPRLNLGDGQGALPRDDAGNRRVSPVVQLSLGYRF